MNLNKIFIIGNLTRDPELKTLPSGTSVASFGMATNRVWKDQSGQKKEEAQFHNIVVFGRQAETVNQYLTKGSQAFIEGRIQTRNWNATDGSKRSRTEIVAEKIQFGPRKTGQQGGGGSSQPSQSSPKEELETIEYPEEEVNSEEIPF
ncbi:single-stranded DNA-binding protein [Patescibacteria group bacterium]|nr:single-stranded DNA-binding protein [Patescibacteria group bacterium]